MYLVIAVFAVVHTCSLPELLFTSVKSNHGSVMLNLPAEMFEEMIAKIFLIAILASMQNISLHLLTINLSCYSLARSAQAYCSKIIRCLNVHSLLYIA